MGPQRVCPPRHSLRPCGKSRRPPQQPVLVSTPSRCLCWRSGGDDGGGSAVQATCFRIVARNGEDDEDDSQTAVRATAMHATSGCRVSRR